MDATADKHDTIAHVHKDASSGHGAANGQAMGKPRAVGRRLPKTQPQVSLYRILLDVEVSTFQQTQVDRQ